LQTHTCTRFKTWEHLSTKWRVGTANQNHHHSNDKHHVAHTTVSNIINAMTMKHDGQQYIGMIIIMSGPAERNGWNLAARLVQRAECAMLVGSEMRMYNSHKYRQASRVNPV